MTLPPPQDLTREEAQSFVRALVRILAHSQETLKSRSEVRADTGDEVLSALAVAEIACRRWLLELEFLNAPGSGALENSADESASQPET